MAFFKFESYMVSEGAMQLEGLGFSVRGLWNGGVHASHVPFSNSYFTFLTKYNFYESSQT